MPQIERWQYQGKVEPLFPIVVATPTVQLEWYVQQPNPIRRTTVVASSMASSVGEAVPITSSTDWHVQHQIPVLRIPQAAEGNLVEGAPPIVSFSWHVPSVALPVRRIPPISEGLLVEGLTPIISFDWLVPKMELPVLRQFFLNEGGQVGEFVLFTPELSWHPVLPHDVPRRAPSVVYQQELAFVGQLTSFFTISISGEQVQAGKFLQYQGIAQPVTTPDPVEEVIIDWLQQYPMPQQVRKTLFSELTFGAVPIVTQGWPFTSPEIPRRLKLTAIEGGEVSGFLPIIPSFEWHQEAADVIRRVRIVSEGVIAFVDIPRIPSFDWSQQHTSQFRRPSALQIGVTESLFPIVPAPTEFLDWFQQSSDLFARLTRREQFIQSLGYLNIPPIVQVAEAYNVILIGGKKIQVQTKAEPLFPIPTAAPSFDWFQLSADVIRRKFFLNEGGTVSGSIPIIPSFAWHQEAANVVRRKRIVLEGGETTGFTPIISSFAWHQIPQLPVRRKTIAEGFGGYAPFTPAPQVFFDWYVTQPDLVRRKSQRIEGGTVGGTSPIVSFSWDVPQSDLVREKIVRQEGMFTSGEPVEVHVDWIQQPQTSPSKPKIRPISAVTEILRPPDISADSWWQQYPDQTYSRKRNPFGGEFRTERIALEIITFDKWWQQQFNPLPKIKRPPTNVVFPIDFITAISGAIFTIRDCLMLEDIFENSLLPLPSGFTSYREIRTASGYESSSEEAPVPSGWVRQDTATPWNLAR